MEFRYTLRPTVDSDAEAIIRIMNYFVTTSFAAYPSVELDISFYQRIRAAVGTLPFYVAVTPHGEIAGFGCLRAYHGADTIRRTAEIAYFLLPEHTGHGIGTEMLSRLEREGKAAGVDTILASISSRNEQSLAFHRKHGFVECGRFLRVGHKFGEDFDMVWMQRFI